MFPIIGLALVAGALSVVLRQYRPEYALAVSVAAGAAILVLIIGMAIPVVNEVNSLAGRAKVSASSLSILLKALGIVYIAQLAGDACRDAGETSLASKIELGGKIAIVALSLPLVAQIVDIVTKMM